MTLTITKELAANVSDRFWSKVGNERGNGCWEWAAWKDKDGYGAMKLRSEGLALMARAHRISYVLHHGEIPDGLIVRHRCDNPSCVNPSHLLLGTTAENMADKVRRGRLPNQRGERNPANKLNDEAVRQIIAVLSRPDPPTQKEIANQFGISQMTVSLIRQGKVWSHIERPGRLNHASMPKGETHKLSKLHDEDIRYIRRLVAAGYSQQFVGNLFGVNQVTISCIALGKTWTHVT